MRAHDIGLVVVIQELDRVSNGNLFCGFDTRALLPIRRQGGASLSLEARSLSAKRVLAASSRFSLALMSLLTNQKNYVAVCVFFQIVVSCVLLICPRGFLATSSAVWSCDCSERSACLGLFPLLSVVHQWSASSAPVGPFLDSPKDAQFLPNSCT